MYDMFLLIEERPYISVQGSLHADKGKRANSCVVYRHERNDWVDCTEEGIKVLEPQRLYPLIRSP